MNAHAPVDETLDPAAYAQAALRRQVEVLERIAEAALELAAAIKDQAIHDGTAAQAAMPFSRVARSARMIALLQSKLLKDMHEARRRDEAPDDPAASDDPLHVHKARVERIVDRIAKAHTDDEDRIDRLVIEAGERLDDDDIYGDILTKPVGELVALICRDLGLDPDWTRLAQEAWAREEIESGAEGSPFLPPPPQAAGGGPSAEEPMVEGAGGLHPPFNGSS